MKIPKEILKAIRMCSKHSAIAIKNNQIIRDWFDENGIGPDDAATDYLIDGVENGNDDGDGLISFLESLEVAENGGND